VRKINPRAALPPRLSQRVRRPIEKQWIAAVGTRIVSMPRPGSLQGQSTVREKKQVAVLLRIASQRRFRLRGRERPTMALRSTAAAGCIVGRFVIGGWIGLDMLARHLQVVAASSAGVSRQSRHEQPRAECD
jgi:hypothetical protein